MANEIKSAGDCCSAGGVLLFEAQQHNGTPGLFSHSELTAGTARPRASEATLPPAIGLTLNSENL